VTCTDAKHSGFIDKTGAVVIAPKFDWADSFQGELASVFMGEKMGYINRKGDYVWSPTN
jgi:hypothetical protein